MEPVRIIEADAVVAVDGTFVVNKSSQSNTGTEDLFGSGFSVPMQAARRSPQTFRMPEVGERFIGFEILRELGRGAAGRVFLAKQLQVADRLVVLKVTPHAATELEALARLRHTNIVPIHSVHGTGGHAAICMPYCGNLTFSDVLDAVRRAPSLPESAEFFVELLSSSDRPPTEVARRTFQSETYVSAVLRFGEQLASGLAHAHDRNLVHCDLKPANVLLTDEGQSMLLDFDVALDLRLQAGDLDAVGGTLGYMSPEQIELILGRRPRIDHRSDVYSLGLILFELLSGRAAFEPPETAGSAHLERSLSQRKQLPSLRIINPQVARGAEAIIHKCLAFRPEDRYPSARALVEDFRLQASDQPLACASEPWVGERVRKWVARNPRLASPTMITALLAVLILTAGLVWFRKHQLAGIARLDLDRRAVTDAFVRDSRQLEQVAADLVDSIVEPSSRRRTLDRTRSVVEKLDLSHPDRPSMVRMATLLNGPDRTAWARQVGEMLFVADRIGRLSSSQTNAADSTGVSAWLIDSAPEASRLVATSLKSASPPRSRFASGTDSGTEELLAAIDLICRDREREALPLLLQYNQSNPTSAIGWQVRGVCHWQLGEDFAAISALHVAIALRPDVPEYYYRRARCYFRLRENANALADLDIAVRSASENTDYKIWRAQVLQQMGRFNDGIEQLNEAISGGEAPARAYFVRGRLLRMVGRVPESEADDAEAMRHLPTDDAGWVERGLTWLKIDPTQALEDFRSAQKINPRSLPAMQNEAHVLIEKLHDYDGAIAVLTRLLNYYPTFSQSLLSRATLHAKKGKVAEAARDTEAAVRHDPRSTVLFQAAAVHARLAKDDRSQGYLAIQYLAKAAQQGHSLTKTDTPNFDAIRDWPEFRAVCDAARALATHASE